uniref:Immunoglobulin C1-set domain-containing protein n=1 Tax=Cyanoderma ruficeps TaxID=181631 RepID=A0A8C3QKI1_9PASS
AFPCISSPCAVCSPVLTVHSQSLPSRSQCVPILPQCPPVFPSHCCPQALSPAPGIQPRLFQGQQELSGHVVATDMVPNGDWTHQLLLLLETSAPQRGVTSSCQVEHVSLEQPLSPAPHSAKGSEEGLGVLGGGLGCGEALCH